jgi:hypothetical protein
MSRVYTTRKTFIIQPLIALPNNLAPATHPWKMSQTSQITTTFSVSFP